MQYYYVWIGILETIQCGYAVGHNLASNSAIEHDMYFVITYIRLMFP